MPSVNYSLNNKGVRPLDSRDAWVKTKTRKFILNPKYRFVGKIDIALKKEGSKYLLFERKFMQITLFVMQHLITDWE